jgi:hypothetical protein
MNMNYIIAIVLMLISAFPATAQNRYALVIGNGNYRYTTILRKSANDAHLLSKKLVECGFKVIEKENLTYDSFRIVINNFFLGIQNNRSEVLLFYSGHGIQSAGENYLMPIDADLNSEDDVGRQCISLQSLLSKLKEAKTKANIVILDACRNNPFAKGWEKGENGKGLSPAVRSPPQSFIAFATAPYDIAVEGNGANSIYSAAIAKFICEPGLNIFQIFQKVSIEVRRWNPNQYPWNNYNMDNDYFFIATKSFNGMRPMEFLVTEDCLLFINGEKKGNFPGGIQFTLPGEAGSYKIKVVNQHDSSQFYDTVYNYNPHNNAADNLMYIPLNNTIVDPKLIGLLDSLKANMIRVDGGTFFMGNRSGKTDESPEHNVRLSSFYIGKYEVTQYQWKSIMKTNPSAHSDCDDCPVENISWNDANKFIEALNAASGEHYRLPTEAEWEFAARGGTLSSGNKFSGNPVLKKAGWFFSNAGGNTHPVNSRPLNEVGISGMSGNVAEWCSDWYGFNYYNTSDRDNPRGPAKTTEKVVRGGSYNDYEEFCKVTARGKHDASYKDKTIGLRLARD